jgi:hypothetical protein
MSLKPNYSLTTLNETTHRVVALLTGLAASPDLAATLAARGFTQAECDRGLKLLNHALSIPDAVAPSRERAERRENLKAIDELEEFANREFRVVQAALRYEHPEALAQLFAGVEPTKGMGSVVAVEVFLRRFASLPNRVQKLLRSRGFTEGKFKHLQDRIKVARIMPGDPAPPTPPAASPAREEALLDLRVWYSEWAETARAVIRSRRGLIRLGLAKQRYKKTAVPTPLPLPPSSAAAE